MNQKVILQSKQSDLKALPSMQLQRTQQQFAKLNRINRLKTIQNTSTDTSNCLNNTSFLSSSHHNARALLNSTTIFQQNNNDNDNDNNDVQRRSPKLTKTLRRGVTFHEQKFKPFAQSMEKSSEKYIQPGYYKEKCLQQIIKQEKQSTQGQVVGQEKSLLVQLQQQQQQKRQKYQKQQQSLQLQQQEVEDENDVKIIKKEKAKPCFQKRDDSMLLNTSTTIVPPQQPQPEDDLQNPYKKFHSLFKNKKQELYKQSSTHSAQVVLLIKSYNWILSFFAKNCRLYQLSKILKELYVNGKFVAQVNPLLYAHHLNLLAKITREAGDIEQAIYLYKKLNKFSKSRGYLKIKLKALKKLAQIYIYLKSYNMAMLFLKKYLKLSWVSNSHENELLAYDYMGIVLYYSGNLQKAMQFHQKSVNDWREPESSFVKKYQVQQVKRQLENNKFDTDYEDDLDIENLANITSKYNIEGKSFYFYSALSKIKQEDGMYQNQINNLNNDTKKKFMQQSLGLFQQESQNRNLQIINLYYYKSIPFWMRQKIDQFKHAQLFVKRFKYELKIKKILRQLALFK